MLLRIFLQRNYFHATSFLEISTPLKRILIPFDVLEIFIKTTILISDRILRDFKKKIGYKLRVKLVSKSIVAVVLFAKGRNNEGHEERRLLHAPTANPGVQD